MKVSIVILTMIFVGCGTYNVPKTEVVEDAGECGEERSCTSEKVETEADNGEVTEDKKGEPDGKKPAVTVSVDVDVKVSIITEDDEQPIENTKYIFMSKAKDWQAHTDATPKGYHLATRAEAITAFESVELAELMDKDETVWTSSQGTQVSDMYWLVGYHNDFQAMKTLDFPALYVANSN